VLHPFVVLPMIDNGVLRLSAEFAGTLGLAALSFRYFESPIMGWAATRRIPKHAA
jgi:peptidoglycan/LPS O-acetylase OafA/YrhL